MAKFHSTRKKSLRPEARRLALAALALLLCGCSSEGGGDWLAFYHATRANFDSDRNLELKAVAAVPYATLGVRLGDGAEQMLILATDSAGDRLWTSSAKIALLTYHGRILQSAGLDYNLSGYNADDIRKLSWRLRESFTWTADFHDIGLYSVAVQCQDRPAAAETISVLGKDIETLRVDEACHADSIDWHFTNTYWISRETGRVWKSIQYIHPKLDAITIELLRPPGTPD